MKNHRTKCERSIQMMHSGQVKIGQKFYNA